MPTETETAAVAQGAVKPPTPKKREDAVKDPMAAAPAPQATAPTAAAPTADTNPLVAGFQQAFSGRDALLQPEAPKAAPADDSAAPSVAAGAAAFPGWQEKKAA